MKPIFAAAFLVGATSWVSSQLPSLAQHSPALPSSVSSQATNPPSASVAPAELIRKQPKIKLPDGKKVIANELKITLKEPFARALSIDVSNKAQRVDRARLIALHPDIVEIHGRHTAARNWLQGEALPARVRKADGSIPRIARNFSAVLGTNADVAAVRASLQRHPQIERVDFKEVTKVDSIPNDPGYGNQWAPPLIGLETAWDIPSRGRIRVAVIDTGVRMTHSEFLGRIVFDEGYGDLDNGNAPTSGDRFDHGTHVAGIIAATRNNIQGVAGFSNDIDLMVLNCATWDADENEWVIGNGDDAIDDAVANGAQVINCSFGFPDDIEDEVEDAYDHSVLVIHSAGNDSTTIAGRWESVSIALLTITATSSNAPPANDVFDSTYSNFGPGVDLAAPGTAIWSTVPGGYAFKDGTSMAAPQVSGAAALIMSLNPTLIGDESTRHLLIRMAVDKGPAGYDPQYGFGALRLNQSTLQACRDATAFVSSASSFTQEGGNYDRPWRTLGAALNNVPDGATLILNGGVTDVPTYQYPPITITKPCTLAVILDRPAIIGN